ncbi:hypothetical protein O6H91_12G039800 [Diphasiastrum complanatum]|uniref:Uncharacterized protein n=1 Tax=Diphasiastrum complanatum TaxID=34168 RepID=A0ACC2C0R7_DIPCM|nr:hypothetical protein O6H91_12G039800 [Diphasiastrum complanatum]
MALALVSTLHICNATAGIHFSSSALSSSSYSFSFLTDHHHHHPRRRRRSSSSSVARLDVHSSSILLEAHANEPFYFIPNSALFLSPSSTCYGGNHHGRVRSCECGCSLQWDVAGEEEEERGLTSETSLDWTHKIPVNDELRSQLLSSSSLIKSPEGKAETKGTRRQKVLDFEQQRNVSIVHDEPGVTRDRVYTRAFWEDKEFMVVDTGGVVSVPSSESQGSDALAITRGGGPVAVAQALKDAAAAGLPALIERQAASAVEEALAIIFVVDGQAGVNASDLDIAEWLRKKHSNKFITLAVNKCESPVKGLLQAADFWCLGFTPIPVSAISGTGTGDLLDDVCAHLTSLEMRDDLDNKEKERLAIAIIGKPNVGKSSILNALVGEERTIVSPVSGTTRDAIDTEFTGPNGKLFQLIDTAGIRRRAAVAAAGSKTESLSVNRALQAIRRSDVVALVIDAMDCVTEQDYKLAEIIEKEGKACIIVVNKWDTIPDKNSKTTVYYEDDVREKLRVLYWAPIVYTSATNNQRIYRILEVATNAGEERCKRISTAILNQVVQEAVSLRQPPTTRGGKKGRIYYCTQAAIRPPTFVFFVNDAKLFPEDYRKYVHKHLRQNVGFPGTPIRLLWRSKTKPERAHSKTGSSEASRMMAAT